MTELETNADAVTAVLDPPATPTAMAMDEIDRIAPNYHLPRLELVSGRGATVVDATGREYLDFVCGIAVHALGHTPPGLSRALMRQMKLLTHTSNLFANRPAIDLAKTLLEATGYDRVFFCNSGTEGIEAALKFARVRARTNALPGRDVLAFKGGFHGRTAFALSTTWHPSYREPFEPLVPGVRFVDYNDAAGAVAAIDENVAAVIVEPVQGENGAVPASAKFLQALRAKCTASGAALIFDEVQSGMGRTGRLLAAENFRVRADYTVMSKALGGGLPLGAVLMTTEAAKGLEPGQHGCTFGGGPVTATSAQFVLDKVRKPSFLARVRSRGRELRVGLDALVAKHASLVEARGLGLLQAIVVRDGARYDLPALITAAREEGLLLVRGGDRAVRLLPPLTVLSPEITEALARLDRALTRLEAEPAKEK